MILRLRQSLAFLPVLALIAGCSTGGRTITQPLATNTSGLHGSLHGGQQPIVGATIQLYAVGTTGDGSASTPLLSPAITTDANGAFDLTNKFTCPTTTTLVYLVATGGNPGLPPPFNNAASTLISALGQCGNPTNITFINLNEVTTVAAVYALASFMTSPTAIGSGTTDTQALADAFALAWEYANVSTGSSPGTNIPTGTTIPVAQINTLANLLSACVNSAGGVSGDSSICGQLFSLTTPSGGTPTTDTTTALLHLALNPGLNTAALYNLILPTAPFQPTITQQPPDFGVRPTVPSDFTVSPSSLDFGSMFLGGTTTQTVTINNNTTHALAINSYEILGANSGDFTFSYPQPNLCPSSTVLPGSSCQVVVGFTPTTAGARHAYFVIHSTSPNPFIAIPLSGLGTVGTAGPITVSPTTLNMDYSGPKTLTLTNAGNTPLSISGITFSTDSTLADTGLYTQTNNCGTTLQAQSICTITVTLHAIGVKANAVMTIADDAAAGPQTVAVNFNVNQAMTLPDYIDFGRISVGQTSSGLLTYIPSSNSTFNGGFGFFGPNAADLSFIYQGSQSAFYCQGFYSCESYLYATPSILGQENATLEVADSTAGSADIPVKFTGVGPGPYFVASLQTPSGNISPPTSQLNLNATVGGLATATFNVNYTGTVPPTVPVPVVSGPHASEFTGTSNCNGSAAVINCTITLTYTPTAVEAFTASSSFVESTNTVQQPFIINASATAASGGITASPTQLTFPGTPAGTLSAPQSVTVTALTNNPINATVNGAFQITQGATCTATPCQVSVVFAPSASASPGTTTGSLNLVDPLTGNGATVYLTGTTTVQTTLSVSPGSLTFPLRSVNSTSIPQTITVTNTGSTNNLSFTSVSLTGANPGDYVITNGCNSFTVPGYYCTINVSFAPTATGTRTANVQIISNSTTTPDIVTLSGTAQ